MALAIACLIVGSAAEDGPWTEVERGLVALALRDPVLAPNPEVAQRCLAWVGLRRGVLQLVEYGQVPQAQLGKLLRAAFSSWQYRRGEPAFARLRRRSVKLGPFYGCRHCDTVCLFRHAAAASPVYGMAAAESALRGGWDGHSQTPLETLREWQLDTTVELTVPFDDKRYARGAALCAVTQILHRRGAPTAVQDGLLQR